MSVTVEGALILLEAKSMMTIDFDKDVGQRVLGTDNMSVKSVMGRHALIQGFMEWSLFGFICGLDNERHGDSCGDSGTVWLAFALAGSLWEMWRVATWADLVVRRYSQ